MNKALVTGGTGSVGFSIIEALVGRGQPVRALVRSVEKGRRLLPEGCELVAGDVTDRASLERAIEGCPVVYHAAGLPEQWLPEPDTFQRVNVGGTRNMIDVALAAPVTRFVYTSTIDVFEAAPGATFDESVIAKNSKPTYYERSKQDADRDVTDALSRGLPAVFLHPAGVYGPAPAASPGANDLFVKLVQGKVPMLLPGGFPLVFSRDVGLGHVLAAERAAVGSRFILSESYLELKDLAQAVLTAAGRTRVPPVLPLFVARAVSSVGEILAAMTGKAPLIPQGQLSFLLWQARPVSAKARAELGWKPIPLAEGLRETLAFLKLQAKEG
jgi:dihydroflavonol-4-reductase